MARTERVLEVDEPTGESLRGLWARAAAADGVGAVSARRSGWPSGLRATGSCTCCGGPTTARWSATPRSPRPARRMPSPSWSSTPPTGARDTAGRCSTRRWPRGAQRVGARAAAGRRRPGPLGRAGDDPQPAPDDAPAHRRGCRRPAAAAGVLGAGLRAGPRRRDLGAAERGRLRPASGAGPADRRRPARADGPAVVRPGRADPRRRGRRPATSSPSTGPRWSRRSTNRGGVRGRGGPGAPGPRARQPGHPARPGAPRPARSGARSSCTSTATTRPPGAPTNGSVSPTLRSTGSTPLPRPDRIGS